MIKGHGGNIYDLARELDCPVSDIVDMSSNVNPLGPPPGLMDRLKERLDSITALPEVDAGRVRQSFADRHKIDPDCLLAGNGSTQFIYCLPRALESRRVLILGPTYADYADACRMNGTPFDYLLTNAEAAFLPDPTAIIDAVDAGRIDTVFICNPNNPTGVMLTPDTIVDLCQARPGVRFVIDESYLGFVPGDRDLSLMRPDVPDNAVVLNSLSKLFRIPGLRIGFVYAARPLVDKMAAFSLPWSVNSLAQAAVSWLMENRPVVDEFIARTKALLAEEKAFLAKGLEAVNGIHLFVSVTSFMLARLDRPDGADDLCRFLGRHRILIRNCANFHGLSGQYVRFSLKTHSENAELVDRLHDYFIDKEMK